MRGAAGNAKIARKPVASTRAPERCGSVAEWLKALVLKTSNGASRSWVRIPPLPPLRAGNDDRSAAEIVCGPVSRHL